MPPSLRSWRIHAGALSLLLALGVVLLFNIAQLPRTLGWATALMPWRMAGHTLAPLLQVLWPSLVYQALFVAGAIASESRRSRQALAVSALCALPLSWFVWKGLAREDLVSAGVAAGTLLALTVAGITAWRINSGWLQRLLLAAALLAGLAGLGLSASDLGMRYVRVGLPALLLGSTAIFYAFWLGLARPAELGRARKWAFGVATAVLLTAAVLGRGGQASNARAAIAAFTPLGAAAASRVYMTYDQRAHARPLPERASTSPAFERYSGLPGLSANLAHSNLLLITIEATRFDETSLAGRASAVTPHLRNFADQGAFWFSRAYSPSNGTLSSMAALLSLTYPSASELDRWQSWFGQLRPEATTVAEAFAAAGFETFRVSHNIRNAFETEMLGLGQGFVHSVLEAETAGGPTKPLDERIASAAQHQLESLAASQRPFFGWIFFGGPHLPYQVHYSDQPAGTPLERYRQELRFTDEQLGRLFATLARTGLLDRTIVVVAADHGEEFREHGGTGHLTLFEECLHIPLVVRVPGVTGTQITEPTSSLFVLPWLLQQHLPPLQNLARAKIERELSPMLAATGGAMVAETISQDRMVSALIRGQTKLVCGVASGWCDVYDLARDPRERTSLPLVDTRALDPWRDVWAGYLEVRTAIGRFRTLDKPAD